MSQQKPLQALLVEDDQLTANITEAALASAGFAVHTAITGAAAIGALTYTRYDLAVVDLKMPDLKGSSLIRALRDTPYGREVKMLVVTGTSEASDKKAAYAAGADTVLEKSHGMEVIAAKFETEARTLKAKIALDVVLETVMQRLDALEKSHATLDGLARLIEEQSRKIEEMHKDMLVSRVLGRMIRCAHRWTVKGVAFFWKHKLWTALAAVVAWWQTGVWVWPK